MVPGEQPAGPFEIHPRLLETSTSNTRRYCSERCMNRANVSAFRTRKRGEDDGEAKAHRYRAAHG